MMRIILASKSPRRKEILEEHGYEVVVNESRVNEESIQKEDVKELVVELAKLKAQAVAKKHKDSIIVAADTLVYFEGEEIGQQKDDEKAERTMRKLLGKTHDVISGLCIINTANNKMVQDFDISYVTLKNVPDKVLQEYIKSGQYKGKAGAYNIDDPEFASFIEKIEGSFTNIKGLPIEKVEKMIKEVQE